MKFGRNGKETNKEKRESVLSRSTMFSGGLKNVKNTLYNTH